MPPISQTLFAATLFLSLSSLLGWAHRRSRKARRVSRGLQSYVRETPQA
ncbi:MAG TPA: hypothetical protein VG675_18560 [Bryobacteraceae bacterium]|nr:hypothetical protein [Bryobacteraceae bacterium]